MRSQNTNFLIGMGGKPDRLHDCLNLPRLQPAPLHHSLVSPFRVLPHAVLVVGIDDEIEMFSHLHHLASRYRTYLPVAA